MSAEEGKALVRAHGREVLAREATQKAASVGASSTVVADNREHRSKQETSAPATPAGSLTTGSSNLGLHYVPANNFGL